MRTLKKIGTTGWTASAAVSRSTTRSSRSTPSPPGETGTSGEPTASAGTSTPRAVSRVGNRSVVCAMPSWRVERDPSSASRVAARGRRRSRWPPGRGPRAAAGAGSGRSRPSTRRARSRAGQLAEHRQQPGVDRLHLARPVRPRVPAGGRRGRRHRLAGRPVGPVPDRADVDDDEPGATGDRGPDLVGEVGGVLALVGGAGRQRRQARVGDRGDALRVGEGDDRARADGRGPHPGGGQRRAEQSGVRPRRTRQRPPGAGRPSGSPCPARRASAPRPAGTGRPAARRGRPRHRRAGRRRSSASRRAGTSPGARVRTASVPTAPPSSRLCRAGVADETSSQRRPPVPSRTTGPGAAGAAAARGRRRRRTGRRLRSSCAVAAARARGRRGRGAAVRSRSRGERRTAARGWFGAPSKGRACRRDRPRRALGAPAVGGRGENHRCGVEPGGRAAVCRGASQRRSRGWVLAGALVLLASAAPLVRHYLVRQPPEIWQVDLEVYRDGCGLRAARPGRVRPG